MGICGIISDLGGVLRYTDHYHYLTWKTLADKLSLPSDGQVSNRLRGVSRMESLEIVLSLGSKTYSQEKKEQMAAERNRLCCSYLEHMGPEVLTLGVVGVLRTLWEDNWKTGIGSSGKSAPLTLERVGPDGFFGVMADGSQITKSKPDPEVFRPAAQRLRLSLGEYIVVEDVSAGILAANTGDLFSIGLGDVTQAIDCRAVLNAPYELSELCRCLYSRVPKLEPSDSTPFSQGGGAVRKEERLPGRRCDGVETCRNVRRVTLFTGKRVFTETLPLRP